MKRQVRFGVFETNSSSVHSLTMCSVEEYERFVKGELLINWKGKFYEKSKFIKELNAELGLPEDYSWEDSERFRRIYLR